MLAGQTHIYRPSQFIRLPIFTDIEKMYEPMLAGLGYSDIESGKQYGVSCIASHYESKSILDLYALNKPPSKDFELKLRDGQLCKKKNCARLYLMDEELNRVGYDRVEVYTNDHEMYGVLYKNIIQLESSGHIEF